MSSSYETHRVRGGFPLVNRSQMVSLSRADEKKVVRDNNSNKNKNVSPNILGRPLIYLGGPPR